MSKTKYLVPNAFTSFNFLLGVWAIVLSTNSVLETEDSLLLAGWFIIYCVLFDKLDGFAAKVMKASSEFGAQFDSLADLIAFGIAPAFLVLFSYVHKAPEYFDANKILVFVGLSLYVLCAAIRLARYNALDAAGEGDPNYFTGVASTLAGAINALVIIMYCENGWFENASPLVQRIPISFLIVTAILMVSNFKLPKLVSRKSKAINIFQITCIVLTYAFGVAMIFPEFMIAMVVIYLTVGSVHANFIEKHKKQD